MNVQIREATPADFNQIWPIFHQIVAAGETYAYSPQTNREEAYDLWMEKPQATYVAEADGQILGTYYIKPNQPGLGGHVCNCGYMVATTARGRGIATRMCHHSQEVALQLGFKAMQFNLVVATNEGAIRLWQKLGFTVIGRLPRAFHHTRLGYVDAMIMYKWLSNEKGTPSL